MKYVQVVTQMEGGGAQRVAVMLSEELIKRGHDSELWFLYNKRSLYKALPYVRVLLDYPPKNLVDYVKIILKIITMLIKTKPDTVITHTYYSNILIQPIAFLLSVPRRIAVQHSPMETYPAKARYLDRCLGSSKLYLTNIAVSDTVISSMSGYPEKYLKKVKRIYNGVKKHSPISDGLGLKLYNLYDIPKGSSLMVNVGRLAQEKNQKLLIQILVNLPAVHLILIGDGEDKAFLQELAIKLGCINRVHFTGEIDPEKVQEVLSICQVFAFPSLYEAMGLALVEAMNQGLPIVASDIPAVREVLGTEDLAGLIVSNANIHEFTSAIKKLLTDREFAEKLGQKAKERAKIFDIKDMTDAYEHC